MSASLFLAADHLPWMLDATAAGVSTDQLTALDWQGAFADMVRREAGDEANRDEGRMVGHTWLRAPERAPSVGMAGEITAAVDQAATLAAQVADGTVTNDAGEPFTDVLHLGIGGSALGPQLLVDALAETPDGGRKGLPVHVVDNVDPDGLARVIGRLGARLRTTLIVVVSKSGSTAETRFALARVLRALGGEGVAAGPQLVAITVAGSKLDQRAADEGWLASLPLWDWVGGRFSLTSCVGLLPGGLAGIDTAAFLGGAADMDAWTRETDPLANPAAVLAGVWHVVGRGRGERAVVVLPYADRLEKFGRYLQQLVMESIGKAHDLEGREVRQGLTVYGNKGSTDQHAFVQQLRDGTDDALVTFVQVTDPTPDDPVVEDGVRAGDQLQGFLLGTRRALAEAGRPTLTITIPRVTARTLGGLVALHERAVGLYASLVGINAYHQPGVEAGKKAAGQVLALADRLRAALDPGGTLDELAAGLDADPIEIRYLLERLAVTDDARCDGPRATGRWTR